jgi:magnesium chelatase family protein
LDEAGRALLRAAMQQLQMTARAYHCILKLARTIADLAGSDRIQVVHPSPAQDRPGEGDPVPAEAAVLARLCR